MAQLVAVQLVEELEYLLQNKISHYNVIVYSIEMRDIVLL